MHYVVTAFSKSHFQLMERENFRHVVVLHSSMQPMNTKDDKVADPRTELRFRVFGENPDFAKEVLDFPDYRCNRKSIVDLHKRIFFCSLIASLAGLKLHFECFTSKLGCL